MSQMEWVKVVVGVIIVLVAIYGTVRGERRCPQCTRRGMFEPYQEDIIRSPNGEKMTLPWRRCGGCGFTERPPGQEHITD